MKIFVTGATGFIGRCFIKKALNNGNEITAIFRGVKPPAVNKVTWVQSSLDAVPHSAFMGCGALVHLAAHGVQNPQNVSWEDSFYWNVTAALRLWEKAFDAGVPRFVICGSCFEYGTSGERYEFIPPDAPLEPTGPYHSSKAAATMAALGFAVQKGVELAILRPFHVYGEGEGPARFWPSLREAALKGADFPMTKGQQVRDFTPVEMVADLFLHAVHRGDLKAGKAVIENVGSGRPLSLLSFAEELWDKWRAKGRLLPGAIPQRPNEVMRYVPLLPE